MSNKFGIKNLFAKLGISPSDVIMIHGAAGVAAQIKHLEVNKRLDLLFEQLTSFIVSEGTLVVPAFPHTSAKNEDFYVDKTPSDVGLFSETFRRFPGTRRSNNPNLI